MSNYFTMKQIMSDLIKNLHKNRNKTAIESEYKQIKNFSTRKEIHPKKNIARKCNSFLIMVSMS